MKHYNIFALQGDDTTDNEVCDSLGLPQHLAGTPAINEAAIKKMHKENYEGYCSQGMNPEDAMSSADEKASAARKHVASLMSGKH